MRDFPDSFCDGWDIPSHVTDQWVELVTLFDGELIALCPSCLRQYRQAPGIDRGLVGPGHLGQEFQPTEPSNHECGAYCSQ